MTRHRRGGPLVAEPLPECDLCERPTHRETWETNGHLCTPCSSGIADTVRMLPVPTAPTAADLDSFRRRRLERQAALDETAFVEGYVPPVPGQLELPEGEPS